MPTPTRIGATTVTTKSPPPPPKPTRSPRMTKSTAGSTTKRRYNVRIYFFLILSALVPSLYYYVQSSSSWSSLVFDDTYNHHLDQTTLPSSMDDPLRLQLALEREEAKRIRRRSQIQEQEQQEQQQTSKSASNRRATTAVEIQSLDGDSPRRRRRGAGIVEHDNNDNDNIDNKPKLVLRKPRAPLLSLRETTQEGESPPFSSKYLSLPKYASQSQVIAADDEKDSSSRQSVETAALTVSGTTAHPPNNQDENNYNNNVDIRSWGCGLTQTPFVFVHIGKAGGGSIRRRIASAAFNYTRGLRAWGDNGKDSSYYPIRDESPTTNNKKAYFCNSGHLHFMPDRQHETFEGTRLCTATTPMGHALACPEYLAGNNEEVYCGGDQIDDMVGARVVYVGHNDFGNEIHWLPAPYLQQWWQQHWMTTTLSSVKSNDSLSSSSSSWIANQLPRLDGHHAWCGNTSRPVRSSTPLPQRQIEEQRDELEICVEQGHFDQWMQQVDQATWQAMDEQHASGMNQKQVGVSKDVRRGRAMSALYSTLPVLRVVMMRNPFSWLASRYSWHLMSDKGMPCEDIRLATIDAGHYDIYHQVRLEKQLKKRRQLQEKAFNSTGEDQGDRDNNTTPLLASKRRRRQRRIIDFIDVQSSAAPGWITRLALDHIYQLCGSDCRARHWRQQATLTELLAQAEANLRYAFVVVGILENPNSQEEFLRMIATRVDYMRDMDPVEHDTKSRYHSTTGQDEECKQKFKDSAFQEALLQASPELAGLMHLYQVAVQVNQFQLRELEQCSSQSNVNKV
ncbi:hypothetical protein ACA910_010460 [Epithemia clementina (nom. ined.)]